MHKARGGNYDNKKKTDKLNRRRVGERKHNLQAVAARSKQHSSRKNKRGNEWDLVGLSSDVGDDFRALPDLRQSEALQ